MSPIQTGHDRRSTDFSQVGDGRFVVRVNDVGQLGNGTTAPSLIPVRVPGASGFVFVGAGTAHVFSATI